MNSYTVHLALRALPVTKNPNSPPAAFFNFHSAQRHSLTTIALDVLSIINATQGSENNSFDKQISASIVIHMTKRTHVPGRPCVMCS